MADFFQHEKALCESTHVGKGTRIWAFAHVLPGARIGADCNVCDGVFIENDVIVGDRVTLKCGVQLWDGIRLEDDVFIGPNATFANDPFPRSRQQPAEFPKTVVRKGASIGANATILPGLEIGEGAMIGAGAVVTKNVPAHAVMVGNPARLVRFIGEEKTVPETQKKPPSKPQELSVSGCQLWTMPRFDDPRGSLIVAQYDQHLPFIARRSFFVTNVGSQEVRGTHAHKACQQFLVALKGQVTALVDDGVQRQEVLLDRPEIGLFMPAGIWGTQYRFSEDALLAVFASEGYDAADYIHTYDAFLAHKNDA